MASGHEYRSRRPNTWLLRPTLQVKVLLATRSDLLRSVAMGPSRASPGEVLIRRVTL
jgi:hypothetical protein